MHQFILRMVDDVFCDLNKHAVINMSWAHHVINNFTLLGLQARMAKSHITIVQKKIYRMQPAATGIL